MLGSQQSAKAGFFSISLIFFVFYTPQQSILSAVMQISVRHVMVPCPLCPLAFLRLTICNYLCNV